MPNDLMDDLKEQAMPAVEKWMEATPDQLYEQMGIRSKAIELDPSKSRDFDPDVKYDGATMGLKEDVWNIGKRLFKNWQLAAYNLSCKSDDSNSSARKKVTDAFGLGEASVGSAIAAALVTQFALAPAIATFVGVLLVKLFFRPTYEEFCKAWTKSVKEASPS